MPNEPDTYYIQLRSGKVHFDLLCSEYQQLYCKGEWWGFHQLWQDWKGRRWVIPYLCSWYKGEIPGWVSQEIDEKQLDFE